MKFKWGGNPKSQQNTIGLAFQDEFSFIPHLLSFDWFIYFVVASDKFLVNLSSNVTLKVIYLVLDSKMY